MDSWNATHGSPELKFENSPAESFLSTPGDMYPSLFGASVDATMDPSEMMSPSSLHEDRDQAELDLLSGIAADSASADPATAATPAAEATSTEKKQTKKRKSWGQVLPEPKTNLPPRKRAKTEDEKEQRRVERVLRNRRAAQSSRERKRLEVEALEQRNKQLEQKLAQSQDIIMSLFEKIEKMRTDSGVVSRQTPVTLSQELFSSHDALSAAMPSSATSQERKQSLIDELLRSTQSQTTVNPASISPALSPVPEEAPSPAPEQLDATTRATVATSATTSADNMAADVSPDLTQHPAEVLCSDLQCRSAEASQPSQPVAVASPWMTPALVLSWQLTLLLTSTAAIFSAFQRPLTLIAMSLKAGFSLPPTALILNTIIWLVTRPSRSRRRRQASTSSTSTSTSQPTPTSRSSSTSPLPASPRRATATSSASASNPTPSTTLRLRLLRKILTCSPSLARPLSDATLAALRLVQSEERRGVDRVNRGAEGLDAAKSEMGQNPSGTAGGGKEAAGAWLKGVALPSKEVLLTLVWALKVEERMLNIRARDNKLGSGRLPSVAKIDAPLAASASSSSDARTTIVNQKILLTIQHSKANKRAGGKRGFDDASAAGGKRRRMG
ncbi:transcriptional activator hac1 [Magnaporthiopsis poae ATCC 64411]|uniref:Transcriptional activator hac1 n=1 Tax=Magnaporthiopsis poae (strain ATCC 64411 / 73-15) TaxID=644358 RepID=A0A0C4ECI3_MAGP6|nr:transcriptional activator hac1 [Magnaporthiopsis poae ATCC 64411]